jgi:phage FluMu gp28-like protein
MVSFRETKRIYLRFLMLAVMAGAMLFLADTALAAASDRRGQVDKNRAQNADMVVPSTEPPKPIIPLTGYQKNWANDKSRFKIGVITRQGGKSFSTSLEACLDCVENPNTTWVLLSAGERQSKELINKAKMHLMAIDIAMAALITEEESEFRSDDGKNVYKQLEILLPNGSRIVGLPANPDTARGWSANIILDEFALHKNSREIWSAMFPTVTRGYKIRVISTFKGKNNKFYELFFSAPTLQRFNGKDYEYVGDRGGWSKHSISIHQAVEMGLELKDEECDPCEPEDLRLALADDDAWDEEFCCIPSDEASAFLTHELISSVEDIQLNPKPEWVSMLVKAAQASYETYKLTKEEQPLPLHVLHKVSFLGDLFVGMDIGRKKDLSVIWIDAEINGVLRTIAAIELKKQPFYIQEQVLWTILSRPEFRRACIDETGIGAMLAERAQDRFGKQRVECIPFTAANKEALAIGLKQNIEDRGSAIPTDNTIRQSFHSVKKYETATKHFRFDAEKTDATGHADHFWGKALAVMAASKPAAEAPNPVTAGFGQARKIMRGY